MNTKSPDPYLKARTEFDEIFHNKNAAIHNWQNIAYIFGVALIISITSNIYTISRAHIVPYIIRVDDLGRAQAVTEAKQVPMNDEKVIKAFVYQYMDRARSIISDPQALRTNLMQVYSDSSKSVQTNFLDGFYKEHNPFDYAQKTGTRHIEPIIFLKDSDNTYEMEWREFESNYDNQILSETHYKALISVIQIPPNTEDKLDQNPLNPFGFYVTSLSWSKLT